MNKQAIGGIIPAVTVCYDEAGQVSRERLEGLYDFLIRGGVNGLFVGGSTGEWPLLTPEERRQAAQAALDVAGGRVPVVMHISSLLPGEAVGYAAWAQKAGASAVSLVMPYYYAYDEEGLMGYFDAVLPKVELPVYLYNIPGNVKNALTPKLLERLAQRYEIVAGVKDSSMDFLRLQEFACIAKQEGLGFFTGNDAQILPCLMWGGNGAISAAAGAFPEVVTRLYACYRRGEMAQAREIQDQLMAYRAFVVAHPALSAVKAALEIRGFATGGLRAPLHSLPAEEARKLHALIETLAFPSGHLTVGGASENDD